MAGYVAHAIGWVPQASQPSVHEIGAQRTRLSYHVCYACLAFVLASSTTQADVLAAWDVNGVDVADGTGIDVTGAPYTFTAGTQHANVNDAKLTLGSGVNPSTSVSQYGFKVSTTQSTLTDAITTNHYIQCTIEADFGYLLNLSSIDMDAESSGTGADNVAILTDIDGFATGNEIASLSGRNAVGTGDLDTDSSGFGSPIDLSGAQYQGISSITFRMYGWNTGSGSGVTYIRDLSGDDLVLNGTTVEAGPANPAAFTATASSHQEIDLSWTKNGDSDDVLIAYNTADSFGTPVDGTSYSTSDSMGGATVIYNGSGTSHTHADLDANVTYYYKAWSVDADTNYSAGITATATTENLPAPNSQDASATNVTDFTAAWTTVSGATGYELDVSTNATFGSYATAEDFTDGNFSASPVWSGDTDGYDILSDATLPNGDASTDGSYLGSIANTNYVILTTPSTEVSEWRFSLGSPDFNPSSLNHFGVILMSDTAITGEIDAANFQGYYIRLGGTDYLELWRKTGAGEDKVGDFESAGTFNPDALKDGLDIRVTRNASGVFELFYATGFTYGSTPASSAGTLTNNVYDSSSCFGVYTHFNNASADRRVYIDNITLGADAPSYQTGYQSRAIVGGATTSAAVTGLVSNTEYFYRVRATNTTSTSAHSGTQPVTTASMATPTSQAPSHIGATTFQANWSPVAEATGYRLDVSTNTNFDTYQNAYADRDVSLVTSHTVTGLTAELTYYYRIRAYDAGSTSGSSATQSVATVLKSTPSNHATDFAAPTVTHRSIVLTWTDASGGALPDTYIVRGSTVGFADIPEPVDSTPVNNLSTWSPRYAHEIEFGVQQDLVFGQDDYGLIPGQTYYFKLFPAANSGADIVYKTDGSVPQISATTRTDVPFEDFEKGDGLDSKGEYAEATNSLGSGSWRLDDAMHGAQGNDRVRDKRALRIRNLGSATMLFNTSNVETLTLEHADYDGDSGGTFVVELSSNDGASWVQIGDEVVCSDTLQTASFTIHRLGAFRLRIRKTAVDNDTNRINIDNLRFTPYEHEGTVFRFH